MTTKFYKGDVTLVIMRKITRRKNNKIRALHKLGYSVRKIADELNCSPTTVQKYNQEDRNYEMPQLNLFPEENLKQKIHVSKPRQPNRESYYPQPTQYYPVIEDPGRSREHYLEEVEYRHRREEDKRIEPGRKFNQEILDKLHQLRMEFLAKQENKRKNLNITNKPVGMSNESHKKFDADIQELNEEWLKKLQEEQQVIDSIPRLVKVELKKAQVRQKAQEDEIQKGEDQHKPILMPLKQVEENESIESDHSEILEGIVLGGILGLCEIFDSYRPPDSKGPMRHSNKYLKGNRKRES